jgi:hypothetical protein
VYGSLCMVFCVWYFVYGILCMVFCVWYFVYGILCMVFVYCICVLYCKFYDLWYALLLTRMLYVVISWYLLLYLLDIVVFCCTVRGVYFVLLGNM